MKKILGTLLLIIYCSVILLLTIKGIPGNPNSEDLIKPQWSETGPLEPSIEGGRFALLYSIVEDKSLEFSRNVAYLATPDLGYRDGKYISLFAPGISFLSIPGYLLGKQFGISQVGGFATIAFFAVLNVYLIRKIAILMSANKNAATIAALAFLFASPAFAYATTFYQHHVSTFVILLSIFILIRFNNLLSIILLWILYGFAFIIDYPNLIMMLPIAIFTFFKSVLFLKEKTKIKINYSIPRVLAIAAVIVPMLFLFWYNQTANGGYLKLSGTLDRVMSFDKEGIPLLGSDLVREALENKTMIIPPNSSFFSAFLSRHMLNGLYIQFLSIDRGMLFYTPVMLFGLISIIVLLKKPDKNRTLLLTVFAFNVILYSMWDDPHGGWAFGSRYHIPAYSILAIYIALFLTKFKKNFLLASLFFATLVYSVGVNTLGATTATTNPPKQEALDLQKKYNTEYKYTYMRNVDALKSNDSKSFFYRTYAVNYMSAWSYYSNIATFIIIIFGFLMANYLVKPAKKVNIEISKKYDRLMFEKNIAFSYRPLLKLAYLFEKRDIFYLTIILSVISITAFVIFYQNGLGLAYNDARSHLDIGRRVVESLKPGFAQLGSVWLPLPHLLMTATVWNDFMWHSGLSGAIQSMVAYVATGILIYLFLRRLGANMLGRLIGVGIFALNQNILYMQSTAMTELPLIALMLAGIYELMIWHQNEKIFSLIKSAFWIMLSTLVRYDGWFLFMFATFLIFIKTLKRRGYKTAEGTAIIFMTLGGFGIFLWLFWNQMIFKDPFFFAFGDFSANAQQRVIEEGGHLLTKNNFLYSIITYLYAMVYNSNFIITFVGVIGAFVLWFDKRIEKPIKYASVALISPLLFNVIALFVGHSVLFVRGLGIDSWFNVRYGLVMVPSISIFVGYLIYRLNYYRLLVIGFIAFVSLFAYINKEAVTLEDARIGLGGKNVTEVSGYLREHATNKDGFVLLSAAKHDAIIFSSGMPMKRFIHEGTGDYWDLATAHPEKWARWIVLRTQDHNDITNIMMKKNKKFSTHYKRVRNFPFAEVYELKAEYMGELQTQPSLALNQ